MEETNRYIQGALGEINRQMVSLRKRKESLLREAHENQVKLGHSKEHEPDTTKHPYGRYLEMINGKREIIKHPRVVYQGEPGAFSEIAARRFFGKDVDARGLYQFEDTFLALKNGEADYAIVPIENSSTGAIRQVYDQLALFNYFFVGEVTVKVQQNLMALPGTTIEDIETVYSHEQGLFQSEQYLAKFPQWRKVAKPDTAGSAKLVAELGDKTKAAICSELAAEIYGLEILEPAINANSQNTTRFIVISPKAELREGRNKICISITTLNESGSLHDILTIFAVHGVNLCRLESRPIPERNWEYMFFIEFTGDLLTETMDKVIHELSLISGDLRVLGNFKDNLD